MAEISRVSLFGKLNGIGYKSIESATVFCKLRQNPYVELAHWIYQILQLSDTDLHCILKQFDIDPSRLAKDITESLDRLPRGATSVSDLSSHLEQAVEQGWLYGSLLFGESQIRTGHLLVGILKTPELKNILYAVSPEFKKIKIEQLTDDFTKIVKRSPEDSMKAQDGTSLQSAYSAASGEGAAPAVMGKQEALNKFATDLTEKARNGEIDPIVGRDEEIRQIIDVLMRRRQNNPILTGEAGVGKTAVVEGFALRIANGDVPPALKDVSLRVLDIGLLQAGASVKGEFENRLRQVIEEVQSSEQPIILFIDEAHTLIGAGGSAGTGDAANLLKPALARGTLRTIAATTWAEYKKYIEKDPALTRRFQVIKVEEPDEIKAILMLRAVTGCLEKHHSVQILDEGIQAAVRLSKRYIPARQLPDKAVSLLDTASARVVLSQHATPSELEDCVRRIESLENEIDIVNREIAIGLEREEHLKQLEQELQEQQDRQQTITERWSKEKEIVKRILEIRSTLREASQTEKKPKAKSGKKSSSVQQAEAAEQKPEVNREEILAELKQLQIQMTEIQGETPLILPCVDAQAISSVVSDWTGIPVGGMLKNEIEEVLNLANTLKKRVIGQDHALEAIAKRILTSRAKIENPNKPIGVMLLVGPSGVGKTESALALAEALYGGEGNLITINMSEFQEAHTVSTLKGSPPGYVGYGEGGVLTEAVRRRPYSIVLLDEVEKAHPDVHEIFFQVFDKGHMEDAEGRDIDFKNTIILLTSNAGTDLIMNMCKDSSLMPDPEGLNKALRDPLLKVFPPALLGRMIVVPYYPISDENLGFIIRLQLDRIGERVKMNHNIPFSYTEEAVKLIASRCTELESGARMVDAILTHTVLPKISQELLERFLQGQQAKRVHIDTENSEFIYKFE